MDILSFYFVLHFIEIVECTVQYCAVPALGVMSYLVNKKTKSTFSALRESDDDYE